MKQRPEAPHEALRREWLASVQPGDTVVALRPQRPRSYDTYTVLALLPYGAQLREAKTGARYEVDGAGVFQRRKGDAKARRCRFIEPHGDSVAAVNALAEAAMAWKAAYRAVFALLDTDKLRAADATHMLASVAALEPVLCAARSTTQAPARSDLGARKVALVSEKRRIRRQLGHLFPRQRGTGVWPSAGPAAKAEGAVLLARLNQVNDELRAIWAAENGTITPRRIHETIAKKDRERRPK